MSKEKLYIQARVTEIGPVQDNGMAEITAALLTGTATLTFFAGAGALPELNAVVNILSSASEDDDEG